VFGGEDSEKLDPAIRVLGINGLAITKQGIIVIA
jgi:hypothetical protein